MGCGVRQTFALAAQRKLRHFKVGHVPGLHPASHKIFLRSSCFSGILFINGNLPFPEGCVILQLEPPDFKSLLHHRMLGIQVLCQTSFRIQTRWIDALSHQPLAHHPLRACEIRQGQIHNR